MAKNSEVNWRCQNYGSCPKADDNSPIPLPPDTSFRCPDCHGDEGIKLRQSKRFPVMTVAGGAIALLALLGLGKLLQPPTTPPTRPTRPPVMSPIAVVDSRTAIDKQVLARPKSELFKDPKGTAKLDRRPKNFERLFVFETKEGWIEVGDSKTNPIGWMKDTDAVDWPHSIVVEYGSPENRYPVLYFRSEQELAKILDAGEQRRDTVTKLYEDIEKAAGEGSSLPAGHPVICMEPGQFNRELCITPVLASKLVEMDGKQARMLQVTAAGMERGATTFDNPEYVKLLQMNRAAAQKKGLEALEGVDVDLVFVVDMTGTMQPWVNGLFAAISDLSKRIESNSKLAGRVRLGLWGYQDNPGIPGIQYLTKNCTPALMTASEFSAMLQGVKVNRKTSDSYPEDVFAGVTDAIKKTKWRSKNRFLIVIGDAPGHTSTKKGGATDMDAPQVRQIATDAGVDMVALAIKDSSDPDYPKYHGLLESQFRTLATNGNRPPCYLSVTEKGQNTFTEIMFRLVGELIDQKSLTQPDSTPAGDPALDIAKSLLESAKVRMVSEVVNAEGKSVTPRDINGWVVDRDLLKAEVASLEPKLLVTRTELNKLLIIAEGLIRNAGDAKIVGGDFYDAVLKAVAGSASNNRTENLKNRLPDFIKGLPYKSEFMEKSKDWWASASREDQDRFIEEMKAKLSYYRMVNENKDLWKPLSREAASGDYVAAIPLGQLL